MARKRSAAQATAADVRSPKRARHTVKIGDTAEKSDITSSAKGTVVQHGETEAGTTRKNATGGTQSAGTEPTGVMKSLSKAKQRTNSTGRVDQVHQQQQDSPARETQANAQTQTIAGNSVHGSSTKTGTSILDLTAIESDSQSRPTRDSDPPRAGSSSDQLSELTHLSAEVQAHLRTAYNMAVMRIASSSHIEKKVTQLIDHLSRVNMLDRSSRPGVVLLHAEASAANKLITVVEITKREIEKLEKQLEGRGGYWYQYSRLDGLLKDLKNDGQEGRLDQGGAPEDRAVATETNQDMQEEVEHASLDGSDEEAFETMVKVAPDSGGRRKREQATNPVASKQVQHGQPRHLVRAVPVMTVFMSRIRVSELEAALGEQTNAPSKTDKNSRMLA